MSRPFRSKALAAAIGALLVALAAIGVVVATSSSSKRETEAQREAEHEGGGESLLAFARENRALTRRKLPVAILHDKLEHGGEAEREASNGPAQQQVDERAYPHAYVTDAKAVQGRRSFMAKPSALPRTKAGRSTDAAGAPLAAAWAPLGPVTPNVPAQVTYTGAPTQNSGRTTAIVVSPTCGTAGAGCRVWIGAAGGGVWRTDDATAAKPTWTAVDSGLTTNAVGSLIIDPNDATGNTLYLGSGEPNASSDSEAGLGLFKTTDGGDHWTSVAGSAAVATDRAIAAVVVDPRDPNHLYIGTAVARHGSSSTNGGRRTPPNAPKLGVYESKDGGASFGLVLNGVSDADVDPGAPADGNDLFTGGVTKMQLDPNNPDVLYASLFGYGVYRLPAGGADSEQVFATAYPADSVDPTVAPDAAGDRTEFAMTNLGGGKTRMYVGDSSEDNAYGAIWRTDDIGQVSANLVQAADTATKKNAVNKPAAWTDLSTPNISPDGGATLNKGYMSYGFCETQCTYDAFVTVDPTNPDTVYIGGSMNYDELFGSSDPTIQVGRTNGRAVMRSTDKGVTFTDMTNDTAVPPTGQHPDQHAIALNPANPGQFFVGSDGGVIRSTGTFTDDSAKCSTRGLSAINAKLCQQALSAVPTTLESISDGLNTLQFQSVAINADHPLDDIIGGTQDNGTWAYSGTPAWTETIGGDGGVANISAAGAYRTHTYYGPTTDVNFQGNNPDTWAYISQPLDEASANEAFSFYVPMVADPNAAVAQTIYTGGEWVWRTKDAGGKRSDLEAHCLETAFSVGDGTQTCGDWERLGGQKSGHVGTSANYIVALGRAPSDTGTLWVGRRRGGLFISKNADAATSAVSYTDITGDSPDRFVSGITVDPTNPNHAWVSFSGYGSYTSVGLQTGHVFEVTYDPTTRKATWTDRSYDLGDAPITGIARDDATGDLYASEDFGVLRLSAGATGWVKAADGMPVVAVYGLTISTSGRVLYAATHGRGVYRVALGAAPAAPGGSGGGGGGGTTTTTPATSTGTTTTTTPGDTPSEPPKSGVRPAAPRLRSVRVRVTGRRTRASRRRTVHLDLATTAVGSARVSVYDEKGLRITTRVVKITRDATKRVTLSVKARRTITPATRWKVTVTGTGAGGAVARKVIFRP